MNAAWLIALAAVAVACSGGEKTTGLDGGQGQEEAQSPFMNATGAFWMISPDYFESGEGDPYRWRQSEEPCDYDPDQTNHRTLGPVLRDLYDREKDPRAWDTVGRESVRSWFDCPTGGSNHTFYTTDSDVQYRATRDSIYFVRPAWSGGQQVGTDTTAHEWIYDPAWSETEPAGYWTTAGETRAPYYRERYLPEVTDREPPAWSQL